MKTSRLSRSFAAFACASALVIPLSLFADESEFTDANAPALETESTNDSTNQQSLLPLEDLRTFTKVYQHIRQDYVEEVSDATLLEYAIKGMLAELDPHSSYLDASSFEDLQESTTGEFGGLGVQIQMDKNGLIKVISPIDDTPAKRAGIEAGDLIIKLDDEAVKGMTQDEAIGKMKGLPGTAIKITVLREGANQALEFDIVRDIIKVTSVRSRMLESAYGYLRIAQFQINTGADLKKQIEKLAEESDGLKGLILDLRNNPGGVLGASAEVVDVFLDEGLIVYTEGRIQGGDLRFEATPGDITDGLPIVVLINGGSASASEIVAGALQDHRRAIIVGTDSFGKGSVQTIIPISEDRAIKLTTALYFTPSGRSIQAQGINPDIFVELAKYTAIKPQLRTTEADLGNHLGNGNGGEENGSAKRDASENSATAILERDNQLFEALNLLKGINVFTQRSNAKPTIARSENEPEAATSSAH